MYNNIIYYVHCTCPVRLYCLPIYNALSVLLFYFIFFVKIFFAPYYNNILSIYILHLSTFTRRVQQYSILFILIRY